MDSPVFYFQTNRGTCKFHKILSTFDKRTGKVLEVEPESITNSSAVDVIITCPKPLAIDSFSNFPLLGRFIMRDGRKTIGVGVVSEILQSTVPLNPVRTKAARTNLLL